MANPIVAGCHLSSMKVSRSKQVSIKRVTNLIWIEQRDFSYECILAYLIANLPREEDPLTLILQYMLFEALDDDTDQANVLQKLDNYLGSLIEIQDSGFQARDCLAVSYCARIFDWFNTDHNKFNRLVLPRLKYAASVNWFDEPELAAVVANISSKNPICTLARTYLINNIDSWIQRNYATGIMHYVFAVVPDQTIATHLQESDWWVSEGIVIKSWALLTFQRLEAHAYQTQRHQKELAESLYSLLRSSRTFRNVVSALPQKKVSTTVSFRNFTTYELTLTLYALQTTGYDLVTGVSREQKPKLDDLREIMSQLEKGGVYISRRQMWLYEIAVMGSLLFLLYLINGIVDVPDVGPIAGAFLEILVQFIILIIGAFILLKLKPTQVLYSEFLRSLVEETDEKHKI